MIKFLREEKKKFSWILWAVVAVFVLYVFVDFGRSRSEGVSNEVAAVVGDVTITRKEFADECRQQERRYSQMMKGNLTPEMKKNLNIPQKVMSDLVSRVLLRKEAKKIGLVVTTDEVGAMVVRDPSFQQDGKFIGEKKYTQLLLANGLNPARFEQGLRDSLLLQKFSKLLERSIVLSDQSIEEEWKRKNEKGSVEYVYLPTAAEESKVTVTAEETKAHYDKNTAAYRTGESRKIKYLLVDLSKMRQQAAVSDDEARADYAEHSSEYQVGEQVHARHVLVKPDPAKGGDAAARAKAEGLLKRALSGEDFAKLARENSDEAAAKTSGGDLGFFGRKQMVPEFDQAAFAGEPGKVIPTLIKTSFGFHVIQVLDRQPPHQRPFEEVAAQIKGKLGSDRADAMAETKAKGLAERVKSSSSDDAMRNLAESTGVVTFNTTEFFNKEEDVAGIGRSPELSKQIFAMKAGEATKEPLRVPRGWIVAKVVEVRPPGVAPLDEIRARVESDTKREKAQQAVLARFEAAKAAFQPASGLGPVAKQLGAEAKTSPEIARTGQIDGLPLGGKLLVSELFRKNAGELIGPMPLPGGGVVLGRVASKSTFDAGAFASQKESLRDGLRQQKSNELLQSLLDQVREREKVRLNEALLQQPVRS